MQAQPGRRRRPSGGRGAPKFRICLVEEIPLYGSPARRRGAEWERRPDGTRRVIVQGSVSDIGTSNADV